MAPEDGRRVEFYPLPRQSQQIVMQHQPFLPPNRPPAPPAPYPNHSHHSDQSSAFGIRRFPIPSTIQQHSLPIHSEPAFYYPPFPTYGPTHQIGPLAVQQPVRPKRRKITASQLKSLEELFALSTSPSYENRERVAQEVGMSNRDVQVWCQNRRAKHHRGNTKSSETMYNRANSTSSGETRDTPPSVDSLHSHHSYSPAHHPYSRSIPPALAPARSHRRHHSSPFSSSSTSLPLLPAYSSSCSPPFYIPPLHSTTSSDSPGSSFHSPLTNFSPSPSSLFQHLSVASPCSSTTFNSESPSQLIKLPPITSAASPTQVPLDSPRIRLPRLASILPQGGPVTQDQLDQQQRLRAEDLTFRRNSLGLVTQREREEGWRDGVGLGIRQ